MNNFHIDITNSKNSIDSNFEIGRYYLNVYSVKGIRKYYGSILIDIFFDKYSKVFNTYYFELYLKEYYGLEKSEYNYNYNSYNDYKYVDCIYIKDINRYYKMLQFNRKLKLKDII